MQAQPGRKKRGAKENITAGGKKPKEKEGEEEPKPYVCSIYRRDVASFLPRAKIQQWRQTSSHSNASLSEFPSELPRFKYPWLEVIFASGDRCIVQKNSFLDKRSDNGWMWGREFNSIYQFRFCCRDVRPALQERASELVEQRLFPNKPDNEGVAFILWMDDSEQPKRVVCRVPNLLTKKTALAMLHFLHHLSQACFEHIEIIPDATADDAECALNPLVLQALPKFRLRGVKFGTGHGWPPEGRLNNLTMEMASEMRIRYSLLFYRNYNYGLDLPWLLDFIANGRQLDKRLELEGYIHCGYVDQIVKYFEEDVHSLEGAIRDVRYEKHGNVTWHWLWEEDWPARCPREAATQVTERDDGTVDYRFDYTNAHSKEPFSLLLGIRHHEGRTRTSKFHLKFHST